MKREWQTWTLVALIPLGFCRGAGPAVGVAPHVPLVDISSRIEQTDALKRLNLQSYSVVRKYSLQNSRMSSPAEIVVRMSYEKGQGKAFQILESRGVQGLSGKVLNRLIQEEAEGSRLGAQHRNSVTPDHYDFEFLGMETIEGRRCFVLNLNPKTKSKYLLEGKAWIDATDYAVVKLEGRPAANLSLFVGRPQIVQLYKKQGEFWMASYNRSISDSHLLGDSILTIEYGEYQMHSLEAPHVASSGHSPVLSR